MIHERFETLIKTLVARTQSGAQAWEPGPTTDSYFTQIGKNSVSVRRKANDIYISLHNPDGEIVESASDEELSTYGMENSFPKAMGLFETAKRNALGADKIFNEILSELKE